VKGREAERIGSGEGGKLKGGEIEVEKLGWLDD